MVSSSTSLFGLSSTPLEPVLTSLSSSTPVFALDFDEDREVVLFNYNLLYFLAWMEFWNPKLWTAWIKLPLVIATAPGLSLVMATAPGLSSPPTLGAVFELFQHPAASQPSPSASALLWHLLHSDVLESTGLLYTNNRDKGQEEKPERVPQQSAK